MTSQGPDALYAITVIGGDRPGIIAAATAGLAELGLNIEDSTMTLLRGHFAMTLVCRGAVQAATIEARLADLARDDSLSVTVAVIDDEVTEDAEDSRPLWMLTLHGGDRPGIVSAVVGHVALVGGNITDLTTRLAGDLYLLIAELDLPVDTDIESLRAELMRTGETLGVGVTLRELETDDL